MNEPKDLEVVSEGAVAEGDPESLGMSVGMACAARNDPLPRRNGFDPQKKHKKLTKKGWEKLWKRIDALTPEQIARLQRADVDNHIDLGRALPDRVLGFKGFGF